MVIAPEGTRSRDGRLGQFKNGAFHLAKQAGVPIVPIVIHNAQDALPYRSLIVRPAEVRVLALEPIRTDDWMPSEIESKTREVRQLYLDTLGQTDEQASAIVA